MAVSHDTPISFLLVYIWIRSWHDGHRWVFPRVVSAPLATPVEIHGYHDCQVGGVYPKTENPQLIAILSMIVAFHLFLIDRIYNL